MRQRATAHSATAPTAVAAVWPKEKDRSSRAAALRVIKKLAPGQRGAVALSRQHGDALVCVRHRQDEAGAFRYTTVELLVACQPIAARNNQAVGIRVDFTDTALRTLLLRHRGRWDPHYRMWIIARSVAAKLGLQGRIVRLDP